MGTRTTNREFVITFIHSDTLQAVAESLGVTVTAVRMRARKLRSMGVRLPEKSTISEKDIEVTELNNLIAQLKKRQPKG
jgi:DNA-binding Lrp family transcriptional regulator